MTRPSGGLAARVVLASAAVAVALVVVEAALRCLAPGSGLRGIHELRRDRPWLYGLRPGASAIVGDVVYAVNADGFRDRHYVRPKPAGTFRVLVLGDSVAFGWGVPLDATFSKVLEADLRARVGGRPVDVLNLAVSGYNPFNEAALLRDVGAGYGPDLVVVQFCINDLNDPTLHFDASTALALRDIPAEAFPDPVHRAPPPGLCRRLRTCTLVADALGLTDVAATLRSVEPHDDPPAHELAWLRTRYSEIAAASTAAGGRFAVVVVPYQGQLEKAPDTIQTRLRALGRDAGWPTVDLLPAFRAARARADGPLFLDHYHLSALGHRVAAESIAAELGCAGLLPGGCPAPPS